MMDEVELRRRLARLVAKTAGAEKLAPLVSWGDGNADERRVRDDVAAGRGAWSSSYLAARQAIEVLDGGNLGSAEALWIIATDFYIDALESRIEPKDIEFLSNSAGLRGRRKALTNK